MDHFDTVMHHMQQMADMSGKQAVLSKRSSALELARIEGEIDVAKARVAVADAEIASLKVMLDHGPADRPDVAHLNARIAAATAVRKAHLNEVEALTSYLEIKKQIAELALDIDPDAMNQVVAAMNDMMGDNPENTNS